MDRLIIVVASLLFLNACFSSAPGLTSPAQPLIDKINSKQRMAAIETRELTVPIKH